LPPHSVTVKFLLLVSVAVGVVTSTFPAFTYLTNPTHPQPVRSTSPNWEILAAPFCQVWAAYIFCKLLRIRCNPPEICVPSHRMWLTAGPKLGSNRRWHPGNDCGDVADIRSRIKAICTCSLARTS